MQFDRAVLVHVRNPLNPVDFRHARSVDLPARLGDLVEECYRTTGPGRRVVSVNGDYVLPGHADLQLKPSDIVVVEDVHEGGEGGKGSLRMVLMIALAVVTYGQSYLAMSGWQAAAVMMLGNALIHAMIPPPRPDVSQGGTEPSATYSTSLSGNQARLEGVIPVGYGFMRTFPDFAAQPYTEFDNETYAQTYKAVLCIGKGKYDIKRIEIDDTPINHFSGSVVTNVVEPGGSLLYTEANVITAIEVSSQELLAEEYTGPYTACSHGQTVSILGVDVVLNGLGVQSGSSMAEYSVEVRFDYRVVNEFGVGVGEWATAISEVITAATTATVRQSFYFVLPVAARIQVRGSRIVTTHEDSDALDVADTPIWAGMRAYLDEAATLDPNSTYVEVSLRADNQLNSLSQRRLAVIWNRKLKTWHPDTGWSLEEEETRNPAWALADMAVNTDYGGKYPDSRVDLATLYAMSLIWDARQDRFDHYFDQASTLDQSLRIAARAGRAVPIQRAGGYTFMRDQQQTLPVAMYTPRNMKRNSFKVPYVLPTSQTPDAVDVRYYSNRTWRWEKIRCPAPGVSSPTRPQEVTLEGVCGAKQAEREGRYMAADHYYRRRFPQWTSQLDGLLPAYGSLVVAAHDVVDWGQTGDVTDYDSGTQVLTLSEAPTWGAGSHYIRLQRPNGTPTEALLVTPGATTFTAVLADALDFTPVTADGGKDRTRYTFGPAEEEAMAVRVKSIMPRGLTEVDISTVLEDSRVHTADNALLPSPGEIQDPVDFEDVASEDGGGGAILVVNLTDHSISPFGSSSLGEFPGAAIGILNDGFLRISYGTYNSVGDPMSLTTSDDTNEWMTAAPLVPAQTIAYEVMASVITAQGEVGGIDWNTALGTPVDTWLNCSVSRTWTYIATGDSIIQLRVKVRNASSGLVLDTGVFTISTTIFGGGGGG